MILCNENERKVLEGILNYLYETHTNLWSSDEMIDQDKEEIEKFYELRKHIQWYIGDNFFQDNNFDLCKFIYKLNGDN